MDDAKKNPGTAGVVCHHVWVLNDRFFTKSGRNRNVLTSKVLVSASRTNMSHTHIGLEELFLEPRASAAARARAMSPGVVPRLSGDAGGMYGECYSVETTKMESRESV